MANIQSNAAQSAGGGGSGPGYSVPNKAAPLPRQWQLPPPQVLVPRNQVALQHFHPRPAGVGNLQPATPSCWMEHAVLLGLWLLVMLTAIAIGQRMLDLSVMTATPAEARAHAHASADAANGMRSVALTAALTSAPPEDRDPFADVTPAAAPAPLVVSPARVSAPATRLTPATTLAIKHPATPLPVATAGRANREPACADALRAMQLCPD